MEVPSDGLSVEKAKSASADGWECLEKRVEVGDFSVEFNAMLNTINIDFIDFNFTLNPLIWSSKSLILVIHFSRFDALVE